MTAVVVIPYDRAWPGRYERVRAPLSDALAGALVSIEHVGGTAVPGLDSSPVVDVAIGLDSFTRCGTLLVDAIERLGFRYVPEYEQEVPERHYFRRDGFHVHVFEHAHPGLRAYARFRDHLRVDEGDRRAYAELKTQLAARFPNEFERYQAAKSPFVEGLLARLDQSR